MAILIPSSCSGDKLTFFIALSVPKIIKGKCHDGIKKQAQVMFFPSSMVYRNMEECYY